MTIGAPGKNGVRTSTLDGAQEILDVFFKHGGRELDTARVYAEGTTEDVSSFFSKGRVLMGVSLCLCVVPCEIGFERRDC